MCWYSATGLCCFNSSELIQDLVLNCDFWPTQGSCVPSRRYQGRDDGVYVKARLANDSCSWALVASQLYLNYQQPPSSRIILNSLSQRKSDLFYLAMRSVPRAFRRLSWSPTVGGFSIEFRIEPRRSAILKWEGTRPTLLLSTAAGVTATSACLPRRPSALRGRA